MNRLEQIKLSIKNGTLKFEDIDWLVQQVEILQEQNKEETEDLQEHGK
ncbi:hypothetical protein ACSU6B_23305 [Neobacillus sp. C211]